MVKPIVNKLSDNDLKCIECDGKLVKTTKADLRKIKIFLKQERSFPRGLWRCEDCGELLTLTVSPVDMKMGIWREDLYHLFDSDVISEEEVLAAIMDNMAVKPYRAESAVISIGEALRCEGLGVGCRHYWLAACGLGSKEICGSRSCRYNPYSPHWYLKLRDDKLRSEPLPDMSLYWKSVLDKALETGNLPVQEDALRRIGTFAAIDRVTSWLVGYMLDRDLASQLREIAINALSNLKTSEKMEKLRSPLSGLLSKEGGVSDNVKRAIIVAIRKMRYMDIELIESIASLSTNKALERDAKITLRVLGKGMKLQKNK